MSRIDSTAAQRAAEERKQAAQRARREAQRRAAAQRAAEARKAQAAEAAKEARPKLQVDRARFDPAKPEKVEMSGRNAGERATPGELQAYKLATAEVKKAAKACGQKLTAGEAREVVDRDFAGWVKDAGKAFDTGAGEAAVRQSFGKALRAGPAPASPGGDMGGPTDPGGQTGRTREATGPKATTKGEQQVQAMLDEARKWLGTSESSGRYLDELMPKMNAICPNKVGPGTPWCAQFATYIMKVGLGSDAPIQGNFGCTELRRQFEAAGRWHDQGSGYTPQPGDMIIFGSDQSHVGIVERVENGKVYTIEGNTSDSCNRRSYNLNDPGINGYGQVIGEKIPGTFASNPDDLKSVPVSGAGTAGRSAGSSSPGSSPGGGTSGGTSGGVSGSSGPGGPASSVPPPFDAGAIDRSLASAAGVDWDFFFSVLMSYYEQMKDQLTESNPEFRKWLDKKGWKPGQKITNEMKAEFLAEKLSGAAQAAGGGKGGLEKAAKKLGIPVVGPLAVGEDIRNRPDILHALTNKARAAGIPPELLFMTIGVESGFRQHSGGDRDSVGLFQQRPSCGWGTVAQCMDPLHAADSFIAKAVKYKGQYPNTAAGWGAWCQKVQVSAFPDRYAKFYGQAREIVASVS